MAQDARIGEEIAGYRIESEIGRGGMSVVYLAEHLRLKRRVALKLISTELAADQTFRDRFVRESQLAASLEDPNIVPIYDAGEAEGVLYIAMRYVQGTDLKELVRVQGPLEIGRAVSIVSQTARALDAAHGEGLVHRDVKPGNILLTASDHVYLSDFGLTKRISSDSGYTATGQFVGTLDYAAPEQFEGKPLDARTDVYSLGCVLHECLTGEPPFKGDNQAALVYAHLLKPPPRPSDRRSDLPAALDGVVAKAMAKSPDDRYAAAGAMAVAAREEAGIEAGGAVAGEPGARADGVREGVAEPPARRGGRRWTRVRVAGVATVALVALLVATLVAVNRPGPASPPPSPPPSSTSNTVWRLNLLTARLAATIPTGEGPGAIAIGEGSVWVVNQVDGTVSRIDPVTNDIATIKVGRPEAITVAGGFAWVISTLDKTIQRIDPSTNKAGPPIALDLRPLGVTAADGFVWMFEFGALAQLDPATSSIVKTFPTAGIDLGPEFAPSSSGGPGGPITVVGGVGWLAAFTHVVRVDLVTGQVKDVTPRTMTFCDIGATEEAVWVLGCTEPAGGGVAGAGPALLFRIDPATGRADLPVPIENGGGWLSVGPSDVWILSTDGSISRFDVRSEVVHPFGDAGRSVGGMAAGANALWVSVDVA